MSDEQRMAGPGVLGRTLALLAVIAAFAALDAWARYVWAPRALPPAIVGLLVLLGLVGSIGWLFVGKPARDPSQMGDVALSGSGAVSFGAAVVEVLAWLINSLHLPDAAKDHAFRALVAVAFGSLMIAWHFWPGLILNR